jgi:hypothetical protein
MHQRKRKQQTFCLIGSWYCGGLIGLPLPSQMVTSKTLVMQLFHWILFTSLLLMATPAARTTATKLLADKGDAAAQSVYGRCLQDGNGVGVDEMQACEYFKRSAAGGNSDAQVDYGYCLEHGIGASLDLREATLYDKWSADQGNASGQFNFSLCLEYGKGISIDLIEAARCYKMSAD